MTALSVNVNKVALLRNTRDVGYPSVLKAARACIDAGAHGITVHPRPDQRHIRPADVFDLAEMLASERGIEYNIEGNPFAGRRGTYPGFLALVRKTRPSQCTLVPDTLAQSTSDHGWDLTKDARRLRPLVDELQALGVRVSLFVDPVESTIEHAKDLGADRVELYTEPYASAFARRKNVAAVFARYKRAAALARKIGLGINAGHDLNLDNLPKFMTIPGILEVSIGHALVADALWMGWRKTVKAYLAAIGRR
jgi:pyridoxine 5-phosphate synthase